jgi:hypothetical protein
MSQKLVPFESGNLPAHLTQMFGESNNDLTNGLGTGGFPNISYKGKVWHVCDGDSKTLVTKPGEDDPSSSLEVVILKANPHLSKVYYARGYEEGSSEKPTCYSNDGKGPAADAQEPQSKSCATCQHNQWGSRISENGSKGKNCSDSRRLAVAPAGDLAYPMLLRVPAGTLKELAAYADMLNRRKAPYQAVITKVAFDHSVAHQKFTFKAVRWLSEEEASTVAATLQQDVIQQIVGLAASPHVDEGLGDAPAHVAKLSTPPPQQTVTVPQAAPRRTKAATGLVSEKEVEEVLTKAEPKAAPKKAAEPAPKKITPLDTKALLDEADSSLDEALSMLDD